MEREPDVEIAAAARADEVRFECKPEVRVRAYSNVPASAESVSERDAARVAFSRLSASQREVLQIVAWEGLDASEAAVVLGCSTGAFRVRLHRARRELAKQLDRIGHEETGASSIAGSPSHEVQ